MKIKCGRISIKYHTMYEDGDFIYCVNVPLWMVGVYESDIRYGVYWKSKKIFIYDFVNLKTAEMIGEKLKEIDNIFEMEMIE